MGKFERDLDPGILSDLVAERLAETGLPLPEELIDALFQALAQDPALEDLWVETIAAHRRFFELVGGPRT